MVEVLTGFAFELDTPALMARVHVDPEGEDAAAFSEMVERARAIARPKILYREVFVDSMGEDTVVLEGRTFTSRVLRRNLADVHRVFAFVITCGMEMDQQANLPEGDFLAEFWWDVIKGAVLGCAIGHFCEQIDKRFCLGKTAMMNPGSGDAKVWPIEQQKPLFDLLGGVTRHIGVELADTFLMRPNKTISGIRFPTARDFRTCQVCHREACPSRSAPFDPALWEASQVE